MKEIDFRTHLLPLKDKLYRLALRITQNHPEAQDVVQETFIRAWERRSELAKVESVEAYMLTVCRNLSIDRCEKCENRNIPLSQTDADAPAADASAQERLEHDERIRGVRQALERLPLRQRMAIQLRDIEGMVITMQLWQWTLPRTYCASRSTVLAPHSDRLWKKNSTMDYKFIEQLLERYFAAETTAEEESLLRAGMAMPDLPEHIAKYREIFECMRSEGEKGLGEDFDQHIMQVCGVAEQPRITVHAQRRSLLQNLRPLW